MPALQHLGALGERQFRLLYAGQLVSVLGDGLLGVTLAFAVLGMPLLMVASFLAGVGLLIFNTLYETMLQRHIPADRLGRVTSYDWFGSLAAAPLGYVLAAPLADLVGVSAALWIVGLGALTVLGSIIANPSVRALRAFPVDADPAGSDSHGTLPAGSVREP